MKTHILLLLSAPLLLVGCGGTPSSSSSSAQASSSNSISLPTSSSISSSLSSRTEDSSSEKESVSESPILEETSVESFTLEESAPASETSSLEESPEETSSSLEEGNSESDGTSESASASATSPNIDALVEEFGEFSIVSDGTEGSSVSYDEDNNVYVLAVCATKAEYTIKGAKFTQVVVKDVNSLGKDAYKGVKLTLDGAAIVSTGEASPIYYEPTQKNVQISAKKGKNNVLCALGEGDGIRSNKNIEVSGKGNLHIETNSGHGMYADGKITLYGANEIEVVSGHDGFHCGEFLTTNSDDPTEYFSGKVTIASAVSQGIEGTTAKGKGLISIDSGDWFINNCESVFKTDLSLTIKEGANVVATNITADPVVSGDGATGSITYSVLGTFTVDGEPFSIPE